MRGKQSGKSGVGDKGKTVYVKVEIAIAIWQINIS